MSLHSAQNVPTRKANVVLNISSTIFACFFLLRVYWDILYVCMDVIASWFMMFLLYWEHFHTLFTASGKGWVRVLWWYAAWLMCLFPHWILCRRLNSTCRPRVYVMSVTPSVQCQLPIANWRNAYISNQNCLVAAFDEPRFNHTSYHISVSTHTTFCSMQF